MLARTVKAASPNQKLTIDDPRVSRNHEVSFDGTRSRLEVANTLSHELRTPLNVIIGICQFLERDQKTPLSPLHRDAVDRMERNARALLESVNQLLAYLRSHQDL